MSVNQKRISPVTLQRYRVWLRKQKEHPNVNFAVHELKDLWGVGDASAIVKVLESFGLARSESSDHKTNKRYFPVERDEEFINNILSKYKSEK